MAGWLWPLWALSKHVLLQMQKSAKGEYAPTAINPPATQSLNISPPTGRATGLANPAPQQAKGGCRHQPATNQPPSCPSILRHYPGPGVERLVEHLGAAGAFFERDQRLPAISINQPAYRSRQIALPCTLWP